MLLFFWFRIQFISLCFFLSSFSLLIDSLSFVSLLSHILLDFSLSFLILTSLSSILSFFFLIFYFVIIYSFEFLYEVFSFHNTSISTRQIYLLLAPPLNLCYPSPFLLFEPNPLQASYDRPVLLVCGFCRHLFLLLQDCHLINRLSA